MILKSFKKALNRCFGILCIAGLAYGMTSCKSDDETANYSPFDPKQEVVVTSFTPEEGGYQDQIVIYGRNFGNKKENVTLKIGGKEAVVVNVQWDKLYAFFPSQAFSGEVEVTVTDGEGNVKTATASKNFTYEAKVVVGTLCGYQNEHDSQGELFGSFDVCTGFLYEGCLAFDPLYPDKLYIAYDTGSGYIAELNLETRTYSRLMSANKFQNQRLRNIAFSQDGKYMLVSTDRADNDLHSTSVWIVTRNANGTFSDSSSCQPLVAYKQCNSVAVHPVNGEVYFNSFSNGELFTMNLDDYLNFEPTVSNPLTGEMTSWTGYREDNCFRELFKIQDPSYEFMVTIHPSGNYAYLTVVNRSYILRSDYDWNKKQFTTPYVIAGENGIEDYTDAVGTSARLHRPYQGVFVKNEKYVEEGRDDVYDFYIADCLNFCIRSLTPDGIMRTYAGHSPSTNGNIWGTEDGDPRQAARFRDVTGIAYSEARKCFYVLDHNNRRIRSIGKESEETIIVPPVVDEETEETETPSEN